MSVADLSSSFDADVDWSSYVKDEDDGQSSISFLVDGVHCGGCVARIEKALAEEDGVASGRVNLTTKRLRIVYDKRRADPVALAGKVTALGYRLSPFDPAAFEGAGKPREKELLRSLAVSGFAAANVMLLSVSVWAGGAEDMGPATRSLLHWVSALIAVPAIAYAGRPFFRSAINSIRGGGLNMDVPISLAVLLAAFLSLFQTATGQEHVYFDSALTLLFFLLIGRYLDLRARGRARSAVEHLMAMNATSVTVVGEDGTLRSLSPSQVTAGMIILAASGQRIAADGVVVEGRSDLDMSLISGETAPVIAAEGSRVFAGTLNLSAPVKVRVEAVGEGTLLSEIVAMVELAEQGRAKYVVLADRAAQLYAPLVHSLAFATFIGWGVFSSLGWQGALLNAISVLIITCPCALALAVPVVQVVASSRLLASGILLKSATALERFARADMIVFDKTGTLTQGRLELKPCDSASPGNWDEDDLMSAARVSALSRHPLARALAGAAERASLAVVAAKGVEEVPGAGLRSGDMRLGSYAFVTEGVAGSDISIPPSQGPEMWFSRPGKPLLRFSFSDHPRADAAHVVAGLKTGAPGSPGPYRLALLSGDRDMVVKTLADDLGLDVWLSEKSPAQKVAALKQWSAAGHKPLMVGDGLNDAPALAAAYVSLSPSSASDISQMACDAVFQGSRLWPVAELLKVARSAERLVHQNFALAVIYNLFAIPLAAAGLVTPLIAAVAMSGSSLVVMGNALRLFKMGKAPQMPE